MPALDRPIRALLVEVKPKRRARIARGLEQDGIDVAMAHRLKEVRGWIGAVDVILLAGDLSEEVVRRFVFWADETIGAMSLSMPIVVYGTRLDFPGVRFATVESTPAVDPTPALRALFRKAERTPPSLPAVHDDELLHSGPRLPAATRSPRSGGSGRGTDTIPTLSSGRLTEAAQAAAATRAPAPSPPRPSSAPSPPRPAPAAAPAAASGPEAHQDTVAARFIGEMPELLLSLADAIDENDGDTRRWICERVARLADLVEAGDIAEQAHAISLMPDGMSGAAMESLVDALEASYLEFARWHLL